jgi:hypothetical protein
MSQYGRFLDEKKSSRKSRADIPHCMKHNGEVAYMGQANPQCYPFAFVIGLLVSFQNYCI